ncbi:DUF3822 family protein [Tenacibaculum geojense]|uniref:DUF3822 family protein n=1 Tax=Tenacibaculum geojense TaxID=915352 RepID=A0ABW3JT82_9FLAO
MQRKNKNTGIIPDTKQLSIQFSLDGFSFCIQDVATKEIVSFTEYGFETPVSTPELLQDEIATIFEQDKELQQDFKKVKALHQNDLYTLVPNDYFDKKHLKTYLDFNIKTLTNDHITFDRIPTYEVRNVYVPFVNINNYLFQNFGEFEYYHHASVLIPNLLKYSENNTKTNFFVNVSNFSLDIVVIDSKKLLLANTFNYQTKEDFIYYILFVAEQLQLDPNEFQLTFIGAIEKESELYNIVYNYVRNVDFIQPSSTFLKNHDELSHHSNFTLIS